MERGATRTGATGGRAVADIAAEVIVLTRWTSGDDR